MIKLVKDYIDDLLVRATHHSLAIENNTITLNETISILLYNTISVDVSVSEFYEMNNHKMAFNYLIQSLDQEFSLSTVYNIHSILLDRLHHEKGRFKTQGNATLGVGFLTSSPHETPMLMRQWIDNTNMRIGSAKSDDEVVTAIKFERIHPYADGNGRTGRLIMIYLLLKSDLYPLVIDKKDKYKYINFLSDQDVSAFVSYAKNVIQQEKERSLAFINSESTE